MNGLCWFIKKKIDSGDFFFWGGGEAVTMIFFFDIIDLDLNIDPPWLSNG